MDTVWMWAVGGVFGFISVSVAVLAKGWYNQIQERVSVLELYKSTTGMDIREIKTHLSYIQTDIADIKTELQKRKPT